MRKSQTLDELLVLQAQQGHKRSLALLVKRWHGKLVRHAHHTIGDKAAAHDVAQETWGAVMRNLPGLRDVGAFKMWIYRICTNKCVSWIRSQQRDRKLNEQWKTESIEVTAEESPRLARVKLELSSLPLNQRQILVLFYLEELSMKEISACLDIPVGTVKSRLYHAREHLKKKYHEKYETTGD